MNRKYGPLFCGLECMALWWVKETEIRDSQSAQVLLESTILLEALGIWYRYEHQDPFVVHNMWYRKEHKVQEPRQACGCSWQSYPKSAGFMSNRLTRLGPQKTTWWIPKIRGPNMDPEIVGLLL